ncbi:MULTISPECIES: sigma-70 family RNA polymerase sigma factor [Lachnospiraceae]|jgi:RNA polymerase sigma factor (sigma-70 family)|uniref:RNA polymerase sigma factor, sigma-70 family n=4 Tax=Lachnospiraceae TaxID=186803 RepID=D4JA51_9FIRM|nr:MULTISPECIES: sigma-70 family RNA polymerase sigma factor [Lachnospiraceae]MBP0055953.1 sigma-70 family RNA polymerase sigma factor [Anaerobutyricum soehngenii]NSG32818.1 sigma-70 family RNA polymerase sigma factor [Coprococcus comes]PLT63817.1 RNA polymerase subunit sigma-70 [Mediterraneibacter gnavus]CBK81222.1 RNA polymerase sigma factor, sigma-70 family [Coprococcus catus GD/7]HBG7895871.1 sigma-70 family RNA polymerase sigma factor [Clostridioides difficile]
MDHPEPKGRKVVFMLTLKELKKIVKVADVEKRIPSVKSLKEHKVVVKEMINADTTISVYDHGYVLYTAGNQSTVFPLHSCDDYEYVSVTGDNKEFNKEFFDNENWYIRLLMEAEDRMAYSQSKISTNHGVFSNSDVTDDAEIMRGSSKDFVDDVIDREILHALIKELTERQKMVLNLVYFEEMRQQDVADYLGIKQQSVNDLLNRALKTMKKKAENEEF